jgi:hypothetical protein
MEGMVTGFKVLAYLVKYLFIDYQKDMSGCETAGG